VYLSVAYRLKFASVLKRQKHETVHHKLQHITVCAGLSTQQFDRG